MTKKMKMLTGLSKAELKSRLSELKVSLIKLNAQVATGTSLKNPSQVKDTKKTIARVNTLLSIREQKEAKETKQ